MIFLRVFATFFIVLGIDGQKNNSVDEFCDSSAFESAVEINVTATGNRKCFVKSVNKLLAFPKIIEFSHKNVSTECKTASTEFKKSLENFELWALESMKLKVCLNDKIK